jgi:predicted SPOUT superfamily RNA methylase MTH1
MTRIAISERLATSKLFIGFIGRMVEVMGVDRILIYERRAALSAARPAARER